MSGALIDPAGPGLGDDLGPDPEWYRELDAEAGLPGPRGEAG